LATITDHLGNPVHHARALVNGVRLHYYTAGSGDPLFLLHGVPKTSYYWRKVLPHLTPHYSVVVPDLRGLGDSERPRDGFDSITMAKDIADLATHLGHETFDVVGEDWGAVTAFHVAAQHRDRVKRLVFAEASMPGYLLEPRSFLTKENVEGNLWMWHANFYSVPDYPELLITGKEREFFNFFFRREAENPLAVDDDAMEEYIRCYSGPGGIRCMCDIYRASLIDAEYNDAVAKDPLTLPVLAIGAEKFLGSLMEEQMKHYCQNVTGVTLPWGHQLAEECPDLLAETLLGFLQNTTSGLAS
jgi:pimeloyl-ACP methyl ester carboxylesterase